MVQHSETLSYAQINLLVKYITHLTLLDLVLHRQYTLFTQQKQQQQQEKQQKKRERERDEKSDYKEANAAMTNQITDKRKT